MIVKAGMVVILLTLAAGAPTPVARKKRKNRGIFPNSSRVEAPNLRPGCHPITTQPGRQSKSPTSKGLSWIGCSFFKDFARNLQASKFDKFSHFCKSNPSQSLQTEPGDCNL